MPVENNGSSGSSSSSSSSARSQEAGLLQSEMAEETGIAVITPAMLKEEEQLEAEGREKERQIMEEARMSWDRDSIEMRYKRLQHLLDKSNIYSKFLLTKMEQQQLEEQRKKEKLEKKKELLNTSKNEKLSDGREDKSAAKKRAREDRTYNISDVMSKELIQS